jgi:preprotein translocase subunit Sec63
MTVVKRSTKGATTKSTKKMKSTKKSTKKLTNPTNKARNVTSNTPLSSTILSKSSNFLPALIIGSLGITSLGLIYKIRQYTKGLSSSDISFIQDTIVSQRNPFTILGIPTNSSPEEIKKACRQLYLKFHPDRTKLDPQEATAKFQEIRPICENMEKKQIVDIFRLIFKYEHNSDN